jgi:hypothetical protein
MLKVIPGFLARICSTLVSSIPDLSKSSADKQDEHIKTLQQLLILKENITDLQNNLSDLDIRLEDPPH